MPLLLLLLLSQAPVSSGAAVLQGNQKARYRVTPEQGVFEPPNYRNNGYQQRVRKQGAAVQLEVLVNLAPLRSAAAARKVSLPAAFGPLEEALNGVDGGLVDQVAFLLNYLRTSVVYDQKPGQDQSLAAVMQRGSGNCVGYCTLALFLLEHMGVKARYVTGIAFREDDRARRLLEGEVLHRWLEIYYDDVGWVFSDPAGKVNHVEATYVVLGVEGVHDIPAALKQALGARVDLLQLKNGVRRASGDPRLDPRLRVRPNRLPEVVQ